MREVGGWGAAAGGVGPGLWVTGSHMSTSGMAVRVAA